METVLVRRCLTVGLSVLAIGWVAPAAAAAGTPNTVPLDLGVLPGGSFSATVAINERGNSQTADGSFHAVRW